jgi:hypothetical protein
MSYPECYRIQPSEILQHTTMVSVCSSCCRSGQCIKFTWYWWRGEQLFVEVKQWRSSVSIIKSFNMKEFERKWLIRSEKNSAIKRKQLQWYLPTVNVKSFSIFDSVRFLSLRVVVFTSFSLILQNLKIWQMVVYCFEWMIICLLRR